MENKRLYVILGIFAVLLTFFGGTMAWLQWRTTSEQETEVVFTVNQDFMCSADGGGNITNGTQTLMPTTSCTHSTYAIQRTITINNVLNSDNTNLTMDLWLNINQIGSGLSNSENLRYAVTTTANDCSNGVVSYGTFTGKRANDKVLLLDDEMYSESRSDTYYLYIWMDSDETSHDIVNQSIDLSLGGECTGASKGEPFYAVYSEDDTSLRFYKEEEDVITEGQPYEGRTVTNVFKAYENDIYTYNSSTTRTTTPWDAVRDNVTKIVVEDEIKPHSLANWFTRFQNTKSIDVTKLNTSNTVDMQRLFDRTGYNVTEFTITGLNNWDVSNVKNMWVVFQYTGYKATTFNIGDLSNWDVSSVITMRGMFSYAGRASSKFNIGNIGNWNVSNVANMYTMFNRAGYSATTFSIGDLSNWNVSNVTDMYAMFYQAGYKSSSFNIGNIGIWDVSSVTDMGYIFYDAGYSATTFNIGNLSNWDVSNVTNMDCMFYETGYKALTINIGNLSNWNTQKVTDMSFMFNKAGYNTSIFDIGNIGNWNISNVTNMTTMFQHAGYSATIFDIGDLGNWNTSKVTDMGYMFTNAGYSAITWNIGNLSDWNVSNVTNMFQTFANAGYNATVFNIGNLSNWNTSKVTNMHFLFGTGVSDKGECLSKSTSWNVGDLSSWNVSNVTDMYGMFQCAGYNSTNFNIGNLNNWNTSNVTDMSYMFYQTGLNALNWSLDLSDWNVNKVISYTDFNKDVETKITAPTWINEDQGTGTTT